MSQNTASNLVVEYRRSKFATIWQKLWKVLPRFSAKHSPFFLFEDGAVLWNQGFGRIAYLRGDRSLTIGWSLDAQGSRQRIVHLSSLRHWDSPHDNEQLSQAELADVRARLTHRFQIRGENIVFQ